MTVKIKRLPAIAAAACLASALVLSGPVSALACTGFYIGRGATADGTVIWGRTEDDAAFSPKLYMVRPAETHKAGAMYVSSTGFRYPYPARTLRYTLCKDSALSGEGITPEGYAEVGMNEKNVAVSATVTINRPNSAVGRVDPLVPAGKGGLTEADLASVLLMQAVSARDACEIMAAAIDKYGSGTCDGTMIGDPSETWYFQSLSGHQYAAVKCPDGKVGLSPNTTGNVDLSDKAGTITSPGLVSTARKAGTLKTDKSGYILIADSYAAGPPNYARSNGSAGRIALGVYYLDINNKTGSGMDAVNGLPRPGSSTYWNYFNNPRPSRGYTLYEAMRLLAFRGEGTPWYAGADNSVSIGSDEQVEAHVFETRPDMPAPLATVEWLCVGPAEFGVYLPYYGGLITGVFDKYYSPDKKAYNSANPDANSFYNVFRQLYNRCKGVPGAKDYGSLAARTRYGAGVKAFWAEYQQSLIEQQRTVDSDMKKIYAADPKAAQQKATAVSKAVAEQTYNLAAQMLAELAAFQKAGTKGDFVPSCARGRAAAPRYASIS